MLMEIYDRRDDVFDDAVTTIVGPSYRTDIQRFYADKTILITGGSGFLGILLIEKLLRSCSDLKKIILIMREKRGTSVDTRLKVIFDNVVFEKMKLQNPNYLKQVEVINGSCEKPNFGLEDEQVKKLQSEVNIIFHSAANVRFDEHIRTAYEINVGGTKSLLQMAKGIKYLTAFVHVSTAYCQSHLSHIEEKFYAGGITDEELMLFTKNIDDRTLSILTPKAAWTSKLGGARVNWMSFWPSYTRFVRYHNETVSETQLATQPASISSFLEHILRMSIKAREASLFARILNGRFNTYTFTKGIAEEIVANHKSTLPVAVFRPTIVTVTESEPLIGWTNNISGATGVFVGSGAGFLRTLYCNPDCKAEIIPADRVVNGLIVVPYHIQQCWYSMSALNRTATEPVYNFATNQENCLTWGVLMQIMEVSAKERNLAVDNIMWTYHLTLVGNRLLWLVQYFIFHLLPAPFFILMERLTKQKPRVWTGYMRLYLYTHLYSFFMVQSWKISQSNALQLYSCLSSEDKVIFNCNADVDWRRYFYYIPKGLGKYILLNDWNNTERAQIKHNYMKAIDRIFIIWGFRALIIMQLVKLVMRLANHYVL